MTVPEIIGKSALEIFTKIKARLDNGVTGVKGDRESAYRTGNVNLTPANIGAVPASAVGAANGVAELDGAGKVLSSQLPSYVDDVLEFASLSAFPATGEGGKIYVAIDTNLAYRWSGSAYVEISPSIALGETSSTAYRGDRGKAAYDHAQMTSGNPHSVTKSDVGLGNVDNTSDADKPVSTAQRAALDAKADASDVSALQAENAVFREYFANMEVYRTASGNPATFSDGYAANLMELVVTLAPTQSGSGDPSPTNVRPIAGATSVTVTRSGEGGANEITVTVPLVDSNSEALTVYGGTLNVTTGELAVTAKYKTLAEWGDMYWHSGGKSFILPVGDIKDLRKNNICVYCFD